jgi:hypothetical protein
VPWNAPTALIAQRCKRATPASPVAPALYTRFFAAVFGRRPEKAVLRLRRGGRAIALIGY